VFESRADFRKAAFAGESELVGARFRRVADFGHARFGKPVDAANSIFEADARFASAVFEKAVTFRRAEFRRYADFALATFGDPASTFRDAQFGPALFFPRHLADVPASLGRLWNTAGYDFRQTTFADKARILARADFQVHSVFAMATVLVAGLGLLLALKTRRPRLIEWCRGEEGVLARICKAAQSERGMRKWLRPASPRERLADRAYLIAAYGVLAVALAALYQTQAGYAIDRTVIWIYPIAGLGVWIVAVVGTLNPFRSRAGQASPGQGRTIRPAPMLDYFDPAYHVPRRCDDFVRNFVTRVSTGVVGLAGPRGAGRSALVRAVLYRLTHQESGGPSPILAVTMPSPPAGDLMAFFSVLFRRVGHEVRRDVRGRIFRFEQQGLEHAAEELIQAPPAIALLPLGAVAATVAFFLASPWWSPSPTGGPSDWTPWLLLASVAFCAIFYYAHLLRQLTLRTALRELPSGRLYIHTERALERLAYEESTTEEREASVALPRGLSFRGRRARALKERATTVATLVDDFGRYVGELRRVFDGGVVVHIDDADRIEELKDVRDLVLRLKSTLVGGVLFLVPLPHVVLDGYRSATEGPAGALAGMLDDLFVVSPMSLDEALRMLARRKFFAPDDLSTSGRLQPRDGLGVTLCVLAGGIPKEILRLLRRSCTEAGDWTARHLVDVSAREAREGAEHAVVHSSLPETVKQRVLEAIARGDDLILGDLIQSAADAKEPADITALRAVLRRFDQRKHAMLALRARLDDLKMLEGDFVATIAAGEPLGPLPSWLEELRCGFVALETGGAVRGGPA
jgi:hypothetical protein